MPLEQSDDTLMYCTWSHRQLLPPLLRARFRDLDHYVRELIASATSRLVIVAPYLSAAGMSAVRDAMAASAERGAWIRLVTSDLEDSDSRNRRALQNLVSGDEGILIRRRIRVLTGVVSAPVLFHAKIVVVDRARGYLGSANLSWRGLEGNFEVGVALTSNQAEALDDVVGFFEAQHLLEDRTDSALSIR